MLANTAAAVIILLCIWLSAFMLGFILGFKRWTAHQSDSVSTTMTASTATSKTSTEFPTESSVVAITASTHVASVKASVGPVGKASV